MPPGFSNGLLSIVLGTLGVEQVWGPQAQLTYWALQQYPHVPEVAKARGALAKQMTAMGVK